MIATSVGQVHRGTELGLQAYLAPLSRRWQPHRLVLFQGPRSDSTPDGKPPAAMAPQPSPTIVPPDTGGRPLQSRPARGHCSCGHGNHGFRGLRPGTALGPGRVIVGRMAPSL